MDECKPLPLGEADTWEQDVATDKAVKQAKTYTRPLFGAT